MERTNHSTDTIWERTVGYSRAVRIGNQIFVSGTTSTNELGLVTGISNPYRQTLQTLSNIEKALKQLGASLNDVVRTRIFITNIDHWETIGKAHGECFKDILPATSMVVVNRLIDAEMLVEIEADAVVG
jgi:enamine deaminase RidA (YjgF/YER057c/UK114 family)